MIPEADGDVAATADFQAAKHQPVCFTCHGLCCISWFGEPLLCLQQAAFEINVIAHLLLAMLGQAPLCASALTIQEAIICSSPTPPSAADGKQSAKWRSLAL
jgi:hypothetical protein